MGIAAAAQAKESLATPADSRNPAVEGTAITCRNVSVRFFTDQRSVTALSEIDLDVDRGELLTLLGPSGCGKSTLLRAVADRSPLSRETTGRPSSPHAWSRTCRVDLPQTK